MFLTKGMPKIPDTEPVGNEEVLRKIGKNRTLTLTIKSRQLKYLIHNNEKEGFENLILT